jgi:uncharacterized protein YndB with AHSA1/START domain
MATGDSEIIVRAPVSQAYKAFTNATALCQWLCDVATVDPRPQGRIYLWWNGDFYSSGHYTELEKDKLIKFRWYSNIDPAASEVLVTFTETDDGSILVRMAHSGPEGSDWDQIVQGFKSHWDQSLENLKSVLETGIDLRIANRPMLGILPGFDFSPEQASRLGVPVVEGMRLDDVLEGMGAAAAGLQKNDVIVSLDGKKIDNDFKSLRDAITGKKGGDYVEVAFFRGPEKKTVKMELSRRSMVQVPFHPLELADQVRKIYDSVLPEVEKCFDGISDAQAKIPAAAGEWSAMEILAHLLHTERADQLVIVEIYDGFLRQADGFGPNNDAYIRATAAAYPSLSMILEALRRMTDETVNLIANLPESFAKDKGSFYQIGNLMLQRDLHYYGHLDQIKAALAEAQKVNI